MKTQEELIQIWGNDLFETFGHHIDNEGWLTADWTKIIEDEIPKWDDNFHDNEEYGDAYMRMYQIDYEENEDKTKIRRIDND